MMLETKGGYESGFIGVYAWAFTCQIVAGFLLVLVGKDLAILTGSLGVIKYLTASTCYGVGATMLVTGLLLFVAVLIDYFVCAWKAYLSVAFAVLAEISCVATVIVISMLLCDIENSLVEALDTIRQGTLPSYFSNRLFLYACENVHLFAAVVVLAAVALSLLLRAQSMGANTRALDSIVFAGSVALLAGTGTFIVILRHFVPSLLTVGILWLTGCFVLLLFLKGQKFFWPRFLSVALAVLGILLLVLSIVTVFVCGGHYISSKFTYYTFQMDRVSFFQALLSVSDDTYKVKRDAIISSEGNRYVVEAVVAVATVYPLIGYILASIRSLLGPTQAEKEMAQDSAQEALEERHAEVQNE